VSLLNKQSQKTASGGPSGREWLISCHRNA